MFFAPPFWQLFLLELCEGGCIYLVYTPLFNIYIYIYSSLLNKKKEEVKEKIAQSRRE